MSDMKSIQQRIRTQLIETQTQPPDYLPRWFRDAVRATSGGDSWTAIFVRGVIWKYRWLIAAALLANLGAGFAEATTLGIFTLALNLIAALVTDVPADTDGTINTIVLQIASFFGTTQPIFVLIVLALCVQIIRSCLDYAGQASAVMLRVWLESDLQQRIFNQLIGIRYHQIVRDRLGNLASYTSQLVEIGNLIQSLNHLLNDLTIIVAYVGVLFWISWQFTLIALIILALLSLAIGRMRASIRRSIKGYLDISVRLNERMLEYLQSIRLIHIFAREEMVTNEVARLVNKAITPRRTGYLRRAMISPLFQIVAAIGIAVFLALGYWGVTTSRLLLAGELVAYMFVLYRILPRISSFNTQLGHVSAQWPYVERVSQLLNPAGKEREYLPGKAIDALHQGINLEAVSLRYPENEREALRDISFTIPMGKMVALVGTSGSGKSSIINLLLGLYRPTSGHILIDGLDLLAYDLAVWRRMIGVVDQDTQIFSSSIGENIRFGKPDATDAEVMAAARIANADDFIQNLPQGYATEVGDRGYRLSGGQRQRIAIARAIIHDPTLLLFDEATSALDSHSERLIQESLEELRKARTVVVIAHRLSTIVKADQILLLESGAILEQGTHQALLELQGRYAAMWRLQADVA